VREILGLLSAALLGCALAAALGCSAAGGSGAGEDVGTISLEIDSAPAGVLCLRVSVSSSTRVDQRLFPLTTAQTTQFTLSGLPSGSVSVVGNAFDTPCAQVSGKSLPSWVSDPVSATLAAGTPSKIFLTLRRNVTARVRADFVGDPTFTEYPIPSGGAPYLITWGFSGDLWFTEREANRVAKITPTGVISEFNVPTANSFPEGITVVGADAWFAEIAANQIGRVTPAGVFTEFPVPTPNSGPRGIVVGQDGNVWFTEFFANKIGRITPGGVVTEFAIPTANSSPVDIDWVTSSELWFTESNVGKIGKITLGGAITEFTVPSGAGLGRICTGFDGFNFQDMWFVEQNQDGVAKIAADGTITEFALQTSGSPFDINYAFDGNVYVPEPAANLIARVNPIGQILEFAVPTPNASPSSIAMGGGPNNSIWFTERTAAKIGVMTYP
jgi:virginiamycin B lyase